MFVYALLLCLLQELVLHSTVAMMTLKQQMNHCELQIPNNPLIVNVTETHDFDVIVNGTIHEYVRVNLCKPLTHECANRSDYAVCFHKADKKQFGVGRYPPEISSTGGNVVFTYFGDQCNTTHNFTAQFELKCDFSEEHNFYIESSDYVLNTCEFHAVLRTDYVCEARQRYNCALKHQKQNYSLDRLRNVKTNYIVAINRSLSVIFNVCQNLAYQERSKDCGSKSAICLIDQSNYSKIKYTNLGNTETRAGIKYVTDGIIKINYESEVLCDSNKRKRLRSTIIFICDINSKESYAEYAGGLESCDLLFVWKTSAACSEDLLVNTSLVSRQNCRITDPISGYTYDFSELHEDNMHTLNENHDDYQFSVCKAILGSQCTKGSGVCKSLYKSNWKKSGGQANSDLLWSPRLGLYLNYSEGDQCAVDRQKYTLIELICADNNTVDIIENHCSTTIKFLTSMACPKICSSFRHTQFDSLMDSAVGYKIMSNDTVYTFNLCVSIDQMEYFNCVRGGAGICKITRKDNQTAIEKSLGYPESLPIVTSETRTVLHFVNGSTCTENKDKKISSQISLICDVNVTKSFPNFLHYNSCVYSFDWRSRQSCGIVDSTINKDCSVDNYLGHYWNLTVLSETHVHRVTSSIKNSTYHIQICGKKDVVDESSIFTAEMHFGRLRKVSIDYTKNITLILYFYHGSVCANGSSHARSVLHLICDETLSPSQPSLLWEEECSVAFKWRTRLVCSPEKKLSHPNKSSWPSAVVVALSLAMLIGMAMIILSRNPYYWSIVISHVRNTWNRLIIYPRGASRMI